MANPKCMLCGSDDIQIVKSAVWPIIEMGDVHVNFGVCKVCSHIQQCPPPHLDALSQYYANFSNYTILDANWQPPIKPNKTQQIYLDIAEKYLPTKGQLYEIGASIGLTLHHFKKAGWRVSGCEPSITATKQASDFLSIHVDTGLEENYLPHQANLDLILMSHVLEHVFDPAATVKRINKALKIGGHFLFEVPNAKNPDTLPPGWFAYEHLSYFTKSTLTMMMQQNGFEIITCYEHDTRIIYPVIGMLVRKISEEENHGLGQYPSGHSNLDNMRRYKLHDDKFWQVSHGKIKSQQQPVYIWAAGIHTSQLLGETNTLEGTDILGIIDSDPQKWGKSLDGFSVLSPANFLENYQGEPIIVSSFAGAGSIEQYLLELAISPNTIVKLYSEI